MSESTYPYPKASQLDIEEAISKQRVLRRLKDSLVWLNKSELLVAMKQRLTSWLEAYFSNGTIPYNGKTLAVYQSKTDRLIKIKDRLDELPVEIMFAVLVLGETTLQATATKLGLLFEEVTILAAKTGCEILAVCDGLGYEIIRPKLYSMETFKIKPTIKLPDEMMAKLHLCLFMPPLIEKPRTWSNHNDGGYKTISNYAILGDRFNKHDKPINYEVLNILQRVPYRLDPIITAYDDEFKPEFKAGTSAEQKQIAYDNFNQSLKENRMLYEWYKEIPELYFVFQYDKRGRVYDKGYHIHIQGNSYRKAMLKFAKPKKLTDRGWYWLKVDLANHYGLDKLLFDDRVSFIDINIDSMLANPKEWMDKADEPLLFLSALESYRESLKTGYSDQIVRLDATTSGPQLMSVLMRDKEAMQKLNVIGSDTRYDFYTLIAKRVYELTPDNKLWGDNIDFKAIRSIVKKPIMTHYYNSTAKPKELLGEGEVLEAFYQAISENSSGAESLKEFINDLWDDKKEYNSWYMPDNHFVHCPVIGQKKSRIEVAEMSGGKAYMNFISNEIIPGEMAKRSLCPNVIHAIDAFVLRTIVMMCNDHNIDVSPIHDSFGVHANDCDYLRKAYRNVLARLYREPIIDKILSQIAGQEIIVPKAEFNSEVYQAIKDNADGYYIC